MMKLFYKHVSKLLEKTLPRIENPLLLFGDHLIPTFTSQNTSHISSKSIERLISFYNIAEIEKIDEAYGTSIIIINGAPWACDKEVADALEDYLNGKKRDKERIEEDD